MKQVLAVTWREYRTRVTSPLFLVTTTLTFLLLVGVPVVAVLFFGSQTKRPLEITVVDHTGYLLPQLQSALKQAEGGTAGKADVITIDPVILQLHPADPTQEPELLEQARQGKLPGLLVLQGGNPEEFSASFFSNNTLTLTRARDSLQPTLQGLLQQERLKGHTVDPGLLQVLQAPVETKYIQISTGEQETEYAVRSVVALVFNLLIYIGILLYAALTFQGVLEEKSSRVMEVLVAAVKPEKLLLGKILGIGLVGLTQFATWAVAYIILLVVPLTTVSSAVAKVNDVILLYMVVYFVLGFFLFAAAYGAAASTISRLEDSQAVMGPLSVLVIGAYLISVLVLQNPHGALAKWSSLIPFFSPMAMVTRLVMGQPPFWEVAVSLVLLLAATLAVTWLAARIYRVGVLLYGSRPALHLIWRYAREG